MNLDFNDEELKKVFFSAEFGLEKECLRINKDGFISYTEHPFGDNPNIQKDFCESQTEFVTDVFNSAEEVCRSLKSLHKLAAEMLRDLPTGREFLWPFSNPPYVRDENDIFVAIFDGEMQNKSLYREYLAEKYGKMKMLYSGIHFNFSFTESFLRSIYKNAEDKTFVDFKNNLYLELSKKIVNYAWLIVYLTAASPVMDGSFLKSDAIGKSVLSGYSSARCSEIGYWNDFTPIISYDSLESYVSSINGYVENGKLRSASELYYPVRLKPRGDNSLENLIEKGINHVEIRVFDDNPLSPIGIFKEDIEFIHILILYLISKDDFIFDAESQINAILNEKKAASFDDTTTITFNGTAKSVRQHALDTIDEIEEYFKDFDFVSEIIYYQKNTIINTEKRYANIVAAEFGDDYVKKGIRLSERYADELLNWE